MKALAATGCALALIAALGPDVALAQWDPAITDGDLLDPWIQARTVVLSLTIDGSPEEGKRAQLDRNLNNLEGELSSLCAQLENTAIRIVARPEFSYDAAQWSHELSLQVAKAADGLNAVFRDLNVDQRADAKAVGDSAETFRRMLSERSRFERDVLRVLGSGSKTAIQALAARWWVASERVNDVKEAVAELRQRAGR